MFNPKIVRAERQSKNSFRRCRSVLPTYALSPFDRDIILPTPITPVFNCFDYSEMLRKCFELIGAEAVKGDFESGMRCFDTIMFVLRDPELYLSPESAKVHR